MLPNLSLFARSDRAGGRAASCRRDPGAGRLRRSSGWTACHRTTSRSAAAITGGGPDLQDDATGARSLLAAAARSAARAVRRHDEARGGRAADASLPDGRPTLRRKLLLLHRRLHRDTCIIMQPGFVQVNVSNQLILLNKDVVLIFYAFNVHLPFL